MAWATGLRDTVYQLRAQGLSTHEIEAQLPSHFPNTPTPNQATIWRWLADPEASAVVSQAASRIRAIVSQRTHDVIDKAYERLAGAMEKDDFRAADAYSRAVVNLTRGFVQDRIEVSAPVVDAPDELANLLARHGVALEQRVNAPRSSETPPSENVAGS